MRRLFALLLAFIMLFSAVPAQAFATGMEEPGPGVGEVAETDPPATETPTEAPTEVPTEAETQAPAEAETQAPTEAQSSADPAGDPGAGAGAEDNGGISTFAFNRDTGIPTDLENQLWVAVYDGNDFPGEPAWYPTGNYSFFYRNNRGNITSGMSAYASKASDVLKESILSQLTQGPTTDGVMVWGRYSASGMTDYFRSDTTAGSALLNAEEDIIEIIKADEIRRGASVDDYYLVWYVIKFQTDTYWHIDGLVLEKETYSVNYYGNGNTSGGAPTGTIGLKSGEIYTVLGNVGNLQKTVTKDGQTYRYTFTGWNTQPDGSGTHYDADDEITITSNVSLYAQWEPPTKTVTVTKNWDDNNNQDALRPDDVLVHLLKDGEHYGQTVTLDASNSWTASWTVPAVDQSGNVIDYHVEEQDLPEGYTPHYPDPVTRTVNGTQVTAFEIINVQDNAPLTTELQVRKHWEDGNNRDGVRPYGVKVQLLKNGEPVETVTLTGNDSWTKQWSGLELNQPGKVGVPNEYTVVELGYVDAEGNAIEGDLGYTASVDPDTAGGLLLTNTRTNFETINIPVEKIWDDDNNRDGIRPSAVEVTLYGSDDSVSDPLKLTYNEETGKWTGTFTDAYKNYHGSPITYTVEETGYYVKDDEGNEVRHDGVPAGYTVSVTGDAANGFTVTNTHALKTVSVPVTKVWADNENQDGIRPYAVVVKLKADGSVVDTLTLTANDNWTVSLTLPENSANAVGQPIEYTVEEIGYYVKDDEGNEVRHDGVPAGYTVRVTGDAANGFTVTNTHEPLAAQLNVKKEWNDAGNQDGNRPDSVIITLYVNGDPLPVLNGDGTQATEQVTKPKLDEDGNYQYDADGNIITETVTVNKYYSLTLNEGNDWKGYWSDMPRFHNGQRISYSVVETGYIIDGVTYDGIPAGYTVTHAYQNANTSNATAIVTNSYTPEETDLNVQKIWNDADNQDGKRPASVTITLYADNEKVQVEDDDGNLVDVTGILSPNEWEWTFNHLPKYKNGKEIVYTVVESEVEEYSAPVYEYDRVDRVAYITNTYIPEKTQVTVTKTWDDENDQDGLRPEGVTVTLYKNGEAVDTYTYLDTEGKEVTVSGTQTLNEENGWSYTFVGLDKMYHSVDTSYDVVYTIAEAPVVGYDMVDEAGNIITAATAVNGQVKVINKHTPETVSVPVRKVWDDQNDQDDIRPDSVTVTLYADGDAIDTKTLTADDNWHDSFDDLPKYKNGEEIEYTVGEAEEDVPSGYTSSVEGNTITNTHKVYTNSITVEKVWDDEDAPAENKPQGAIVTLYKSGAPVEEYEYVDDQGDTHTVSGTVTLDRTNDSYTWPGLEVNNDGVMINYTVLETGYVNASGESVQNALPDYYSVSHSYTHNENGTVNKVTVTNTYENEMTSLSVLKVWADTYNQDGLRPEGVIVTLYADGSPVEEYAYTDNEGTELTLPGTVTLNSDNSWDHTFEHLPMYDDGEVIDYTVKETGYVTMGADGQLVEHKAAAADEECVPEGYTVSYDDNDDLKSATITNTHEVEKTFVTVSKIWDDANNRDDSRPGSITVTLYRNGAPTDKTLELNAENNWTGTFENLDVHYGVALDNVYSIEEESVSGYTVKYGEPTAVTEDGISGTSIEVTNSHKPAEVEVTVSKNWDDAENQDGIRPTSITVTLWQSTDGGETWTDTGKTLTLDVNNNWKDTFTGLQQYREKTEDKAAEKAVEILYRVKEEDVEGYHMVDGEKNTITSVTAVNGGASITNYHDPLKATLNVEKVWDDANNQDGKRPDAVIITLHVNGSPLPVLNADGTQATEEVKKPVLDADGNYQYDADGTLIIETVAVDKYYTLTLNDANGWKGSWPEMPRFHNGQRISYSVVETDYMIDGVTFHGVPTGYTVEHEYQNANTDNATAIVTNSYKPEETGLNVQKIWDDADNQDGIRPESVTVTLWQKIGENGEWKETGKNQTMSPTNEWDVTFDHLPKYSNGVEIFYKAVEDQVEGYEEPEYHYDMAARVVYIVNTHVTEKTKITVTKEWNDADNQDGKRPTSVTVTLYKNGEPVDTYSYVDGEKTITVLGTQTLNADNNWTYTYEGLEKNFHSGEESRAVVYTVVETEVPLYTPAYEPVVEDDVITGYTVINTHEPELVTIPVTKNWDDNHDQDGKRPDSITVTLKANGEEVEKYTYKNADGEDVEVSGTMELTAESNWHGAFVNLPRYAEGEKIVYSIVEEAVEYYNVENGVAQPVTVTEANDTISITNTHEIEKVTQTAIKVWDDANNQDGVRPDSIIFHLYADGVYMGETYDKTLTADNADPENPNQWIVEWTGLDKYQNGELIRYTVYEEPIVLKSNESEAEAAEGEDPNAGIDMQAVEGYSVHYERVSANPEDPDFYKIKATNTYIPDTIEVTAVKIWVDGDDRDGLRVDEVTVELYADGKKVEKYTYQDADGKDVEVSGTMKLTADGNWHNTWTNLPKYAAGKEIKYEVREVTQIEGYKTEVISDVQSYGSDEFFVVNTHEPAVTNVTVTKNWADEDNNDGKRPEGIVVQLYANGSAVEGAKVVLNKDNNWSYIWQKANEVPLYVYENGKLISYDVGEVGYVVDGEEVEGLPDGYKDTYPEDGDAYTVEITNTYATKKTAVSVVKEWQDGDDQDGLRPESITVVLYKNGEEVKTYKNSAGETISGTVVLNEANNWRFTWDNLYVYQSGEPVDYKVREAAVPTGYEVTTAEAASADGTATTITLTNTHVPETKEITVSKVWKDNNDEEDLRPTSVSAQLYKNGQAYGDVITLSAGNSWSKKLTVPVYEDGKKIEWTVKETKIPKYYTVSYNQSTLTITNTIQSKEVPDTGDYTNIWFWVCLLAFGTLGAVVTVIYDGKKKIRKS